MMAEQNPSENSKIWVEVMIVFLVVLSVFGAALLTQQDQPFQAGSSPASARTTESFSPTPRPVTPTPTPAATSVAVTSVPPPAPTRRISPADGTSLSTWPATPTPTQVPLTTVVSWIE